MKVTAVETIRLAEHPQMLWVQVHTDTGLVGLGETCLGPATVEAHIHETVAPYLLGKDPRQVDRHSAALSDVFVGYQGTGAETRGNSAVDIALWDLRGQECGAPVLDLLGGASRPSIRIYNTCAGYSYGRGNTGALKASDRASEGDRGFPTGKPAGPYEDLQAAIERPGELARDLLEQGIRGMKVWPFDEYARATGGHDIAPRDLEAGLDVLRRIRAAVGDAMDVMVELHAVWHLPAAIRIAKAAEAFAPYWFEDAVKGNDLEAATRFAASTHVPVAMGETLAGRQAFSSMMRLGAARIVMFDVGWVGGLTEAKKVATLAEAHDLPVAPHDCTGPVVLVAGTNLSLNAPNAVLQETVRAYYTGWYRDIVTELPAVTAGSITAPGGPGLGTALRPGVTGRGDARVRVTSAADAR
jgi:L-alanine-DL-glutamate epimerase-like enolase superfamily enzyme